MLQMKNMMDTSEIIVCGENKIDIFDKMVVQIKYANDVQVSYSLVTYSPFGRFSFCV